MLVAPSWNVNYAMHTECGVYIYIMPLAYCGQSVQLLVKTMSVEQHMHSNCMCHMFVHAIMMSYIPTHHS